MLSNQCIVGLGNPGPSYANSRHNLGFIVVDWLVKKLLFPPFCKKFNGEYSLSHFNEFTVIFFKPMLYMNNSGAALQQLQSFYKFPIENIIVIHDDADLKFGHIKVKKGGSSGGHNGLKSIDNFLGNNYWRVRVGVARTPGTDLATYILANFSPEQKLDKILTFTEKNFTLLLQEDKTKFSLNFSPEEGK